MREVAIVVPTYVRSEEDFDVVERMLISLRQHEPEVRCILVDDASPERSLGLAEMAQLDYDCEVVLEKENRGFSTTVNVGIRMAMEAGQDVILANSDLEFRAPFVEMMSKQQRLDGSGPAEVVGALLVYPEPRGLIQHGGVYFCSPGDEPVLTVQDGYVPIEQLDSSHGLVSYARKEHRIFRCATEAGRRAPGSGRRAGGGYSFSRGHRPYAGEICVVQTKSGIARVTPNHKFTAHWNRAALGSWCVYAMRRGTDWRIGHTKMAHGGTAGERGWAFGPRLRMDQQGADGIWILSLHGSSGEALMQENLIAWTYGAPTWQFKTKGTAGLTQQQLDYLWRCYPSHLKGLAVLADFGRDPETPLMVPRRVDGRRRLPVGPSRRFEIAAANLMPAYMTIPTDPGHGQTPEMLPFGIEREPYVGDVYSLEVDPHKHYVSNGIIVHNSVLTRTFHHMFQFGPEDLLEAQLPAVRPCTGALQLVRYDVLEEVGLYDESYKLGYEDVDFNVRVLRTGGQVVYQPLIRAWHGESIFRGQANEKIQRWTRESWVYFCRKWRDENFVHWVPSI